MWRNLWLILVICVGMPIVSLADVRREQCYELLEKGDVALREKRYHDAAKYYWQAAEMGVDHRAISNLGHFYNKWRTRKWEGFDWELPARYLARVADVDYHVTRDRIPEKYDGNFFIIARESSIVERLGIGELKKTRSGNDCCERAVKNLHKCLYVDGPRGRVEMRAVDMGGDLGTVAVIDSDNAIRTFDFVDKPITDWEVYVRSPHHPHTLLLFNNFHRIVYEEKMASFCELCCKLGASEASVDYLKSDSQLIRSAVRVNGSNLTSYESASAEVKTAVENSITDNVKYNMQFNDGKGSTRVHAVSTPWFNKEPSWRAMYNARRNRANPVTEYTALFNYTDDCRVNVATKTAFEKAGYKVAANSQTEFKKFIEMVWRFHVKFPGGPTIVVPEFLDRK